MIINKATNQKEFGEGWDRIFKKQVNIFGDNKEYVTPMEINNDHVEPMMAPEYTPNGKWQLKELSPLPTGEKCPDCPNKLYGCGSFLVCGNCNYILAGG